jgi:uncharacterized membrane protein YkvA (DUF1232 family)
LRVDFTDDDAVLAVLISACRAKAEQITSKSWAPQTIQAMFTLPQTAQPGTLSGSQIDDWYFNESLGSSPWSLMSPIGLKLPQPPLTAVSLFEYRETAFSTWKTWPATSGSATNWVADTLPTPGLVYLQSPPAAYQYRLTYTAGYSVLPPDLKPALMQLIAWKYENRLGENPPEEICSALMGAKNWSL